VVLGAITSLEKTRAHGPWGIGHGVSAGLFGPEGDGGWGEDTPGPLGDGVEYLVSAALLEGTTTIFSKAMFTIDSNNGDLGEVGLGNGTDGVGHARASGALADTDLARSSGIAISGITASLLMAAVNHLDAGHAHTNLFIEDVATGYTKMILDSFFLEHSAKMLATLYGSFYWI